MPVLTTFITLLLPNGSIRGHYQNSVKDRPVMLDGEPHNFLSFLYEGAMRDRQGDNIQAELILAQSPVTMNMVQWAVKERWLVRATSCAMHPETMEVANILSRETWAVTGPSYDPAQITVELASALDAFSAVAPSVKLTSAMVGSLPVTGRILNL